ncbi:MAG TPA: M1 family aminopeptidase, partial [Candidatus Limnocylindrales bacterium]|nr:M1 family aminopeptidase [Candidatus Limnocylindrales bacterium]
VRLRVIPGGTLHGKWPRSMLAADVDLSAPKGEERAPIEVKRNGGAVLRVPRSAPVHYGYSWVESKEDSRQEADARGRPGPLHLILASRDTSIIDTLRALAPKSAPRDSILPSMKTLRFHADRVHDFAWVASPDYVRGDTTWGGIRIRALAFRDDQKRWRHQKAHVASAMGFMSREVGPYIWPMFTSAESWVGGGAMEYPMLIMNDPDLVSDWYEWLDVVIAHELAHNWFYGMLGSDERAHPWLDEGFTQLMEDRYGDWKYPRGFFKRRKLLPWTAPYRDFFNDESRYLARVYARDEVPIATPADECRGWAQYGVTAYSKPAMMLRALEGYMGKPKFSAFLHEYYRSNLLRHPRPADVVKAAEKVWGGDLGEWFAPWLYGTSVSDVSIGGVHHQRIEQEPVTRVRVHRDGERTAPVRVEARYADGQRERWVVPEGRGDTRVFFEDDVRVSKVVLDPDHEVIEPYRLDNQSGWPPLRFRPIFDFPSSEAMTFLYGPVIWHGRAEGARLGLWSGGHYLPSSDFPEGVLAAGGSAVVGTRRGDFSWSAWTARRAGALGARGRVALESARDAGLFRAGARVGNLATAPGRRHPFREWRLSLDYRDRYDLAPVDPRYWSPGRGLHGKALLALDTQGPRRAEHTHLDVRAGAPAFRTSGDPDPGFHYERVSVEARQRIDLLARGNAHLSWRVFGGSAFDRPPREQLFDAAEASRVDSLGRFYLNDRGPLLGSGHYLVAGGGGLRGYRGRAVLGKRVWGANVDLEIPLMPVSFFGDVGRVEATGLGESDSKAAAPSSAEAGDLIGRTLADAGLAYVIGPIRITAPLWVGRPNPNEKPWRFRWLVSIASFPISF